MPKAVLIILSIFVIIVVLVLIVSLIASWRFNLNVKREIRELFNKNLKNNDITNDEPIRKEDLEGLPPCVQKWLEHAQVIGKKRIKSVRLKQKSLLRTTKEGAWMHSEAEQYFTVDKPGFIWKARVNIAPLLYFTGRDKYDDGRGNMNIKVLACIPVVNATGKEMNQGVLLRYLAEMMWFPTAALSSYISWEEIDENSARATMSYGGVTASGVFMFNDKGDFINFEAKRYMESKGQFSLETWSTPAKGYKTFNGIRIPNKSEAIWKLQTGDFTWYQGEITEIEYNNPYIY